MPGKTSKVKPSAAKPYELTLGGPQASWKIGVVSLVNEARLPSGAVVEAKNMMQTQDGVWATRWGSKNYGVALTGPITGFSEFIVYNSNGTSTQYYCVIDNGTFKYAKDGGAWTSVTGHTFSTTVWSRMIQYQNKMLIANGIDQFSYIDLKTFTFVSFTALTTPSSPTLTLSATLSSGQFQNYYQVTAVSQVGETVGSAVATISTNVDRNNWYNPNATQVSAGSTYYVTLTFPQVTNAIGYNIYYSDNVSGVTYYLDSVSPPASGSVTYTDYGSSAVNDFIEVPTFDTTSAPKFSWIALSDNRLWACGNPQNPQRIYWSAVNQQYPLAFSPYLGGGWVDVNPGASQQPHWVGQFRDGKGDPMTSILMAQPSGYGSTWHVSITTSSIGNTSIAIPSLIQSLGTFGTLSPFSVIETNENVYFHSPGPGGFYSTGSVPTLFNVLSTNEVSILIRPDVKLISLGSLANLTGIEYDRKLWYSVPYNNSTNNRIFIYDLEKENWNPYAFDFGVNGFVRYMDNSGSLHLLAIPTPGDSRFGNQIIEINPNYLDDNGTAFQSHLQTGLIHVSPDHIQFAHVNKAYYEFGDPQGTITMTYSGTMKNEPLGQLESNSEPFGSATGASLGFSAYKWSAIQFSEAFSGNTDITTDISVKKRQLVNKIINNWEAEVVSQSSSTAWTLNTISVVGMMVPVSDDNAWIMN